MMNMSRWKMLDWGRQRLDLAQFDSRGVSRQVWDTRDFLNEITLRYVIKIYGTLFLIGPNTRLVGDVCSGYMFTHHNQVKTLHSKATSRRLLNP